MKLDHKHYVILLVLVIASCRNNQSPSSLSAYKQYLADCNNGFCAAIDSRDIHFKIQFIPNEYKGLMSVENNNQFLYTAWFQVDITTGQGNVNPLYYGTSDNQDYNHRLEYFLITVKNNISLVYGQNIAPQVAYYFEGYSGLKPAITMTIGYSIPDSIPKREMLFSYTDNLFSSGILNLKISQKRLENLTHLPN